MAWRSTLRAGRWVVAGLVAVLAGCAAEKPDREPAASVHSYPCVLGLALNSSRIEDNGYNEIQYQGIKQASSRYRVPFEISLRESAQPEAALASMKYLVEDAGCTVVFASAEDQRGAVDQLAKQYPKVKFILLDAEPLTPRPNIAAVKFLSREAAYLAGALAARMSKSGVVAVVGGAQGTGSEDLAEGFAAGAKAARKDIRVPIRYITDGDPQADPWNSPRIAATLTQDLTATDKADIIFAAAGGSNYGVFDVVKSEKKMAIGVDADQDGIMKGVILTSVMKRLDTAIERLTGEVVEGRFENKVYVMGLANGGVGLSPMLYTRQLVPPNVMSDIEKLKADIIAGKIKAAK
ncbi:MAG TPA: BMP family ABC transporter substrate-binding protein [Candidatus Brocadiia bacterium]|nr:BMP family ABC transporter substrate-binding protein [Candidatus Brocadiia bacterium]